MLPSVYSYKQLHESFAFGVLFAGAYKQLLGVLFCNVFQAEAACVY